MRLSFSRVSSVHGRLSVNTGHGQRRSHLCGLRATDEFDAGSPGCQIGRNVAIGLLLTAVGAITFGSDALTATFPITGDRFGMKIKPILGYFFECLAP